MHCEMKVSSSFLFPLLSQVRKKLRLDKTMLGVSSPSLLSGLNQLVVRSWENCHKEWAVSSGWSLHGHSCRCWWVVFGVGLVAATQKRKGKAATGKAPVKYCGPKGA